MAFISQLFTGEEPAHAERADPSEPEQKGPTLTVGELRRRHLEGTLDDVLIPNDPQIEKLLEDLFPAEAARRSAARRRG